ncbi:hypothetical protein WISP_119673 [Willisornis vidua]|uniref:Uncharacterized protein n=1 Tax=Willisornis vidua TaxID=1566151 RepID=A0ABQ9CSS6_9PASS|nr:hypothetical protein WISP_119673 [Willisornis vidua]
MAARRWALWLQGLALLWGCSSLGLAQTPTGAPPAQVILNPKPFDPQVYRIPQYVPIYFQASVSICYLRPDEEEEQLARKREERRLQSLQRVFYFEIHSGVAFSKTRVS